MPTGYPDYFGVSIFEQFGTNKRIGLNIEVLTSNSTKEYTISDTKGKLYAGSIYISSDTLSLTTFINMYIDNILLTSILLLNYSARKYEELKDDILSLKYLSYDYLKYEFEIVKDITFVNEMKIQIINNNASDINVGCTVKYAQVVQ